MSESLSIHHDVGGHQFETTVDGHRAYLAYMDLGKQTLDIYRTFVPDSLRGRGIAAALTEHALQYADRQDCGSWCRGFDSHRPPHISKRQALCLAFSFALHDLFSVCLSGTQSALMGATAG
ncbi:GNAT family N-acetyltransferase [Pseudomonas aeruginosa]|uniref:GNAT family N-acetyltransferase n=1 Tax=Pseudomonas aeruginosa TaxID=287 RepID=UPI003BF5C93D